MVRRDDDHTDGTGASGASDKPGGGRVRTLRATTDDRERVLAELSAATGRGKLTLGEFEERSAAAWAAVSRRDLAVLPDDIDSDPMGVVLGVPGVPGSGGASAEARLPAQRTGTDVDAGGSGLPDPTAGVPRVTGRQGSGWSVAVMSGVEKQGEWSCGSRHQVVTVMGGGLIDLRDAYFETRETVITVTAVMGGAQILVPEDVRLVEHGFGLMGDSAVPGRSQPDCGTRTCRPMPRSSTYVVWR